MEQGVGSLVEGGKEVDCNCKTPFAGKQRAINVIAVQAVKKGQRLQSDIFYS